MARNLGECLVSRGLASRGQLEVAQGAQRQFGGSLGTLLLALDVVEEETLLDALSEVYGVPSVSREELLAASPEVLALLSPEYSRRHRALPFRIEGEHLLLAMQVPGERLALDEAAFLTGFAVEPRVATETAISAAIAHHHHAPETPLPALPPELVSAARAQAPPPRPPVEGEPPRTPDMTQLPDIGRRLANASDRDSVVAIAADALARFMPRSLVFAIRGGEAVAVEARAIELPATARVALPVGERSVISPALEGRLVYGPVELVPANQDLYTLLGGRLPVSALVIPVVVRGRTVLVLYADDPLGTGLLPDFEPLKKLGSLVACAIEIAILKAKILRETGN